MKSFKEIAIEHLKHLIIRLGDCYIKIYFDNGEVITINPNDKANGSNLIKDLNKVINYD